MEKTILGFIKKVLQIPMEDTQWDDEILMAINLVVAILMELGVELFEEEVDATTVWPEHMTMTQRAYVRSYMSTSVKQTWDPPKNDSVSKTIKTWLENLETRIVAAFGNDVA